MNKIIFTCIMIILTIGKLHAQDLIIHDKNGNFVTVPLSLIDSITFEEGIDFTCGVSTVTDVEGNNYSTVQIGNQCWLGENLKTTRYRNNTAMRYPGDDVIAWETDSLGAYAWYDNDTIWKDIYGALYNWHAVDNPNGLCPFGWHVATDIEFEVLKFYLDYSYAGSKLKSTRTSPEPHPRWDSPNTGATNETNWTAFPGGRRLINGSFDRIGAYGQWWVISQTVNPQKSKYQYITHNYTRIFEGWEFKKSGLSVRCVRHE